MVPNQVSLQSSLQDDQPLPSALARALLYALKQNAEKPCFVHGEMRLSYRQLNLYLFGFLAWLRKQGVSPGSAITFLSPKTIASSPIPQISILCVVAGLSAMLGGYVMVESGQARRTVVLWDASAPPSESTLSQFSSPQLLPIPQDWFAALEDDLRGMTLLGLIRETVTSHPLPCLMAKSSGTTGTPKVIPIMPDMMLLRAQRLVRNEPLITNSRLSMNAVAFSNQTFLHVLSTLLAGGSFAIQAGQATLHVLTPGHFRKLYENGFYKEQTGFRVYDRVKIVGSAITMPLLKQLRQVYSQIQASYGSTEAGPTSSCRIVADEDILHVGVPYPDLKVEVVDDSGNPMATDKQGYLRIRSKTVVAGYAGDPGLTRKAIRDGWFYPGDIASISHDGRLYVIGRDAEMFNLDGFKINANEIDRILQACPQTADALAFLESSDDAIPAISALVELVPSTELAEAISAYEAAFAQSKIPSLACPRRYYICDSIPRNINGKPMRRQASEIAHKLTPVSART